MTQKELALSIEIDRISSEEYPKVFGHRIPGNVYSLPLEDEDFLRVLRQVIDSGDESLWDSIAPSIPTGSYS